MPPHSAPKTVVVRAAAMAAGGDAICRPAEGGPVVFASGAVPGELVVVALTATKKDFSKGVVVEVLESSPHRRVAPCAAVAKGCGGCGWQHIDPAAQHDFKVSLVRDALARIGKLLDPAVTMSHRERSAERYRTTVRVAVDHTGRAGFRRTQSNDVVVADDCLVAHPALAQLLPAVRADGGEVVLRVGARTGDRLAFGNGVRGLPADVRTGQRAFVDEIVCGVRLRASAMSFFQPSPEAAESIVESVGDALGEWRDHDSPLADLYGGVGLFAATLAGRRPVTVVELSESSVGDARRNLAAHGAATIVTSSVERWRATPHSVVIADPARSGLDRGGVGAVVATGCERLVLVSCDAASLGRDTRLLAEAGYVHAGSAVLDPFPQTPHVEVVTRFDRGG